MSIRCCFALLRAWYDVAIYLLLYLCGVNPESAGVDHGDQLMASYWNRYYAGNMLHSVCACSGHYVMWL